MAAAAENLGTIDGYSQYGGYGAEQGQGPLREKLAERFYADVNIQASDIFVSDGSKCDISRLQMMFGGNRSVAVQDPSYPAYVDSSVMIGNTETYDEASKQYGDIVYLACSSDNDFFPNLALAKDAELIFFCSPNNPTGAAATREQLTELVKHAKETGSIIIYDAAYSIYISNPDCPKTIFEIPGADECCIETCSFSKYAGFTGLRSGWTVVPEQLKFMDGSLVKNDWNRLMSTSFNGASNIAQAGGMACLSDEGMKAMSDLVSFYKDNAVILKKHSKRWVTMYTAALMHLMYGCHSTAATLGKCSPRCSPSATLSSLRAAVSGLQVMVSFAAPPLATGKIFSTRHRDLKSRFLKLARSDGLLLRKTWGRNHPF
jgi:LL-diaminopimelate aminotransferase